MKSKSEVIFYGFSINTREQFQKTKEYLLKSSIKPFSSARPSFQRTNFASSSSESLHNCSSSGLMAEHQTSLNFEFYVKAKMEIAQIKTTFEKIKELNKKSRKITFGNSESLASRIGQTMIEISKQISDCESSIKENGSIFAIDKTPKIKAMVATIQNYLIFELGKVKSQYKQSLQEITLKHKSSEPVFLDNSKFSFINEYTDERTTTLYDSRGNKIKIQEIGCDNQSFDYIYKNIIELGKIMKDLEEASFDQGCLVDRIDLSLSTTLVHSKKANMELIVANQMLKNDLGEKVSRILLIFNILVFVLLIIKVLHPRS